MKPASCVCLLLTRRGWELRALISHFSPIFNPDLSRGRAEWQERVSREETLQCCLYSVSTKGQNTLILPHLATFLRAPDALSTSWFYRSPEDAAHSQLPLELWLWNFFCWSWSCLVQNSWRVPIPPEPPARAEGSIWVWLWGFGLSDPSGEAPMGFRRMGLSQWEFFVSVCGGV